MGELADRVDRVASAEGLGMNRNAPVAFRAYGGIGDDGLDLPGQDAVAVMGESAAKIRNPRPAAVGMIRWAVGRTAACAVRRQCRWRRRCPI